ncbi:hypothetical protein ACO0QE_000081 [Hanseniaspora vineae]
MNNQEIVQEAGIDFEQPVPQTVGTTENMGNSNNTDVLHIINNKDMQIAELTAQLASTSSSLQEQINNYTKLDLKFSEFKKNNSTLDKDFEIEELKIKVKRLQKSDELKQAELNQLQKQYSDYRLNKNNEFSGSDYKMMLMEAEIRSTKEQNALLVENLSKANKELQELLFTLKKVKDEHTFDKQHFIQEMDVKQRTVESLEQNLQTVNQRCKDLEESLSHDNKSVPIDHYNEVVNEMNDTLKELNQSKLKNHELQELVDTFVNDNDGDSQYLLSHLNESNDLTSNSLSFKILQKELIKEKNQKQNLQRQLETFVEEMKTKLPQINQYDANLQSLQSQLCESLLLIESNSEKMENFKTENQSLKQQKQQYEHTIKTLQQQRVDLAKQVQTLAYLGVISGKQSVISEEDCKFVKNLLNNHAKLQTSEDAGIQTVISRQLVAFKNVQQLQENNENLLLALRELGDKLEFLENQGNNLSDVEGENAYEQEEEKVTVEQAKEAILKLERYNDSLVAKLENVTEERDILKTLCHTDNTPVKDNIFPKTNGSINKEASNNQMADKAQFLEEQLHNVQANYHEETAKLNKDIQNYIQEKTELAISLQKEINKGELLESQYKLLSDNKLPQLEKEIESLKETISRFSNANLEKDMIHNKTMNEMLSMVQTIESLRLKNTDLNHEIAALQQHIEEYKSILQNNKDNKVYTARDIDLLNEQIAALSSKNDENIIKLNDALLAKSEAEKKLEVKEQVLLSEIDALKHKIEMTSVSTDEFHIKDYETLQREMATVRENLVLLESEIESLKKENNDLQHSISLKDQEIKLANESVNRWKQNCSNVTESLKEMENAKNKEISDTEERYEDKIAKLEEELNIKSATLKTENDEIFRKLNLEIENLKQTLSAVEADAELKSKALLEKEQSQASDEQIEALKKQMDEQLQERIESIKKKSRGEIRQLVDKKRAELARSFEKSVETKANSMVAEKISKIEENNKTKIEDAKKKASEDAEKRSAMKIKILENKLKKMKDANVQGSSQGLEARELARPVTALSNNGFGQPSVPVPSAMSPLTPNMAVFGGFGQTTNAGNFPVSNSSNFPKFPNAFNSASITNGNTTTNLFGKRPFENASTANDNPAVTSNSQDSLFTSSTTSGTQFAFSNARSSETTVSQAQESPEKKRKLSNEHGEAKQDTQSASFSFTPNAQDHQSSNGSGSVSQTVSNAFTSSTPAFENIANVESVVEKSESPETFKELSPAKTGSVSQEAHAGEAIATVVEEPEVSETENATLQNKISQEETADLHDELMPDANLNEEGSITKDKEIVSEDQPSTEPAVPSETPDIANLGNETAEGNLPLSEYTDDAEQKLTSAVKVDSQGLSDSPVDAAIEAESTTTKEEHSVVPEAAAANATSSNETSLQPVEAQAEVTEGNDFSGMTNRSGAEEEAANTFHVTATEEHKEEQKSEPEHDSSVGANLVFGQETANASQSNEPTTQLQSNDEAGPFSLPNKNLEAPNAPRTTEPHVENAVQLFPGSSQFSSATFAQQGGNDQTEEYHAQAVIDQEIISVEGISSEQQPATFTFAASEQLREEAVGTPIGEETPMNEATVTTPLTGTTPITQAEEVPDALAENEQASTPDSVEEA